MDACITAWAAHDLMLDSYRRYDEAEDRSQVEAVAEAEAAHAAECRTRALHDVILCQPATLTGHGSRAKLMLTLMRAWDSDTTLAIPGEDLALLKATLEQLAAFADVRSFRAALRT